ncbi:MULTISPECIES: metal-dependent hydrolase [unclassified Paenibacillus]|uniref:metal-dependent hydrolase n=1 Tax=unclassified Paenibacillus TaxID=185978 RepID=UPI001C1075BC|nr:MULTISPECIES: metal-dependent hydrolase [unclassified Paenibacillus]MBU5441445.1 metal-dependent hydrolase [Paenibacillus sp. MSJ-34]CAH0118314.1 putative protein YfhP [Paenibacillus sp. CECT 9249]
MDTGTHLVMGLGLAGLSYIDPAVAANSSLAAAVLLGTVIGSQAPDFDDVLRLKSNAFYVRHHRGITHSLLFIPIWTLLVTLVVTFFFRNVPVDHVAFWVFFAVCLHNFTDLFNPYGTQAFWPLMNKRVSWNIIHLFDPVIFATHVVAIFMWAFGLSRPNVIFPLLYGFLILYYLWRTFDHNRLERNLPKLDSEYEQGDTYVLIPTVSLSRWHVVKTKPDRSYMIGKFHPNQLEWIEHVTCSDHPAVSESKQDECVQAMLHLSSYACAEVKKTRVGYVVRWSDVRFRHRRQFPFVAVVMMDKEFQPLESYVGWINDKRIEKRLRLNSY